MPTLSEVKRINSRAYDSLALKYDLSGPARAQNSSGWLSPLWEHFSPPENRAPQLLELGSGDGHFARMLSDQGFEVTAIEQSNEMARLTRTNAPSIRTIHGNFLEYCDKSADVVIATAVIHFLPPPYDLQGLTWIKNALLPKGKAFVSTTIEAENRSGFEYKEGSDVLRFRSRYTEDSFLRMILEARLSVKYFYRTVDWKFPQKCWGNWILENRGDS